MPPGVQAASHQTQCLNRRQLAYGLGTAKTIAHDHVVATMTHARHAQIRASLSGNHSQAIAHRALQLVQVEPTARQARNLGIVLNDVHAQALVRHQCKLGIGKPTAAQHEHTVDTMPVSITHCVLSLKHVVKRAIVRKDGLRPTLANVACALVNAALHQYTDFVASLIVHAFHTRQPMAGSRNLQTGSTDSDSGRAKRRGPQSNAGNDAGRNTRLVHLELLLQIKAMVIKSKMTIVLTCANRANHVDTHITRIPGNLARTFYEQTP